MRKPALFPIHTLRPLCGTVLASALVLGTGCSSSRLADTWVDPQWSGPPLRNVLVVSDRKDPMRRALWEDKLVQELGDRGVAATACHRTFPDSLPTQAELRRALQSGGFDGLLLVAKPRTQERSRYVPGAATSVPETVAGPFFNGYATIYHDVYSPGYTEIEKTLRIQFSVYRTGDQGGLLWGTTSETLDPSSAAQVSHEVSQLVVPALVHAAVIP
jgi:hypothetical protein